MKDFEKYIMSLGIVFKKPIMVISSFGILSLTSLQMAIVLLFVMLILDYFTGVLGSYYTHKTEKTGGNVWFTSEKTKKSLVKTITYFVFILLTYGIHQVFEIRHFSFPSVTKMEISITLFSIAICCAIEFYSIFWENLPKAGMDIPKKIVSVVASFKDTFNKIKE